MNAKQATKKPATKESARESEVLTDAQLKTVDGAAANEARRPTRPARPHRPRIFGIGLPPE